jgi:hypothetical protein
MTTLLTFVSVLEVESMILRQANIDKTTKVSRVVQSPLSGV